MSNKNKTQQELDIKENKYKHKINNEKNSDNFKKLKKRRHGIGKHRV